MNEGHTPTRRLSQRVPWMPQQIALNLFTAAIKSNFSLTPIHTMQKYVKEWTLDPRCKLIFFSLHILSWIEIHDGCESLWTIQQRKTQTFHLKLNVNCKYELSFQLKMVFFHHANMNYSENIWQELKIISKATFVYSIYISEYSLKERCENENKPII